jgi:hypothetical protein
MYVCMYHTYVRVSKVVESLFMVPLYVCIYARVCMCVYICVCMYIHTNVCIYVCIHTHMCVYIYIHIYAYYTS